MKQLCALALFLVVLPLYAAAQEAPRYEVFTATQAMQDPTVAMPDSFKSIEKDMRAYRTARDQYAIVYEKAFNFSFDVASLTPKTGADLKNTAQEFDTQLRQLTQFYAQKNDAVKRMQSTEKGKRLWRQIVEIRPEYNDALVATYDTRYHQALVTMLTASRDAYRVLSVHPTPFTFSNGQLYFTTPEQTYTYLRSLSALRKNAQESIASIQEKSAFLLTQPNIVNMFGYEFIAQMETAKKEKEAQLANWARTTPLPANPVYSAPGFFMRVQDAVAADERVITSKAFFSKLRTDLAWTGAFQKADFVSAATLAAASEKVQKLLTPLLEQEQTTQALSIKMGKEISEQYNINRAIYALSDSEYTRWSEPATVLAYTHALLEYQKKVYAQVQSCFPAKGKAKCTVKVVDDITLSVSDKKIQKSLDMLKSAFLSTYKPEYDRYKGKTLP